MQKFYQELFERAARQKQLLSQLFAAWAPAGEGGRWGPTVLRHKLLLWRLLSCINFCFFYFKDVNVKQRKMNKFLERLKLLETYSQELLKTDAKISQSEDLIQFFRAQTQDLDPCFPEDSVVIMPSEIGGEKKKQAQQQLSITNPQASQSYRCVETFETKDTKNQAFKVAQKEIVEVLLKDMTGWWLVENADKQLAWFPASYLEEIDVHEDSQDALSSLYFVVRAYESQKADELSLHSGVVVEVVRKSDNGWWLIRWEKSPSAQCFFPPLPSDTTGRPATCPPCASSPTRTLTTGCRPS
uniref:SH3 domain-containing protein n=1 Tax=Anas platyrhynchos platyrhynchos TaxID=8840 RepID=A0A493U3K8_ANAPP